MKIVCNDFYKFLGLKMCSYKVSVNILSPFLSAYLLAYTMMSVCLLACFAMSVCLFACPAVYIFLSMHSSIDFL